MPSAMIQRAAQNLASMASSYKAQDIEPANVPPEPELDWERFVPQVRAILHSIREPSEQMLDAAFKVEIEFRTTMGNLERGHCDGDHIYQAMIDAALSE